MTILLVEDDPGFSKVVAAIIERIPDVQVICARGIREAMEEMRRIPPPDFVFLDLGLTDSLPPQTVETIPRFIELNPNAPVCVLSGTVDEKMIQLSKSLGADLFQAKMEMRSQSDLWNAIKRTYANRVARGIPPEKVGEELLERLDALLIQSVT